MMKMTKKDFYGRLIEVVEGANVEDVERLVEFLNHEIELVSRKRNVQTKTQKENEVLVEVVYEALANIDHPVTVTDFQNETDNEQIKEMSNQKVSALLKKLYDAERITKTTDKKKSYFAVVE